MTCRGAVRNGGLNEVYVNSLQSYYSEEGIKFKELRRVEVYYDIASFRVS